MQCNKTLNYDIHFIYSGYYIFTYGIFIVAYTIDFTSALRASQLFLQAKTSTTTTTTEAVAGDGNEQMEVT